MNLFIKYNFEQMYQVVLREQLEKLGIEYNITGAGCIKLSAKIEKQKYNELADALNHYGISIIESQKAITAQRIKDEIRAILYHDNGIPMLKMSAYLSQSLNENYRTLSSVFSEVCHMSIESYVIFQKIELVKQLLLTEKMSLTEISHKLQYSSVAHLSNQFKNLTGFNPSVFQKIASAKMSRLN
jgi:AraC-like DNA-binding protein